uniref:Transcriptional regulator n=1 Tax=Caudovirales sp. ctrNG92 TaxID=2827638 RepID=A0A8S5SE43_9CAUD|nr:MAG TPA: Transcriptional regulator [Caudovirales sp. ctrNG92]
MNVGEVVKKTIEERGVKQKWVVEQMNNVIPDINMNSQKLSAVTKGQRQFKCDELIAFCKAMKINPDVFLGE